MRGLSIILLLLGGFLSSCTLDVRGRTPTPPPMKEAHPYGEVASTLWPTATALASPVVTPQPTIVPGTPRTGPTATSWVLLDCQSAESAATPSGLPEPTDAPIPLTFRFGTTYVWAPEAEIAECGMHRYRLHVWEGQSLSIHVWPNMPCENWAQFCVTVTGLGDGWTSTSPPGSLPGTWFGSVPASQAYLIEVLNRGPAARYSLTVDVPRWLDLEEAGGRMSLPGWVEKDALNIYEFHADEGDHIAIRIASPGNSVWFDLNGPDGEALVRAAADGAYEAEVTAQLTGVYQIVAGNFCCSAGEAFDYTIYVEISD